MSPNDTLLVDSYRKGESKTSAMPSSSAIRYAWVTDLFNSNRSIQADERQQMLLQNLRSYMFKPDKEFPRWIFHNT